MSAVEQLRQLGFDLTDTVLDSIGRELNCDVSALSVTDLLLGLGLGDYDYSTDQWSPRSSQVYAFDAEIYNIEKMYTLFLQGVQTIVPDIVITDVHEDLSAMTDEMTFEQDSTTPPNNGKRSVSFVCNGHAYSVELDSYGDWFNNAMFDFMDHVLEKEHCRFKLYEFPAQMQFVIMIYCSESQMEKVAPLVDEY